MPRYVVRVEPNYARPGAPSWPGRTVRFVYADGASEPIAAFTEARDAREFRDEMNRRRR